MKIKTINDFSKNYLVLENDYEIASRDGDFEMRMIMSNDISGLLAVELRTMDGKMKGYYDISSKISFAQKFETEKINYESLKVFINSLKNLEKNMSEFLLDGNCLVITPENIFYNEEKNQYDFCLWPFEENSLSAGLRSIFAYVLSVLDYDDRQAVRLAYDLQKQTAGDNFVIDDVLKTADAAISENESIVEEESVYEILAKKHDASNKKMNEWDYEREAYRNEKEGITEQNGGGNYKKTGFLEKAALYFKDREPGEIFDDFNELKIFKKIKEAGSGETTDKNMSMISSNNMNLYEGNYTDFARKSNENPETNKVKKHVWIDKTENASINKKKTERKPEYKYNEASEKRKINDRKSTGVSTENDVRQTDDLPYEIIDLREEFIENSIRNRNSF